MLLNVIFIVLLLTSDKIKKNSFEGSESLINNINFTATAITIIIPIL